MDIKIQFKRQWQLSQEEVEEGQLITATHLGFTCSGLPRPFGIYIQWTSATLWDLRAASPHDPRDLTLWDLRAVGSRDPLGFTCSKPPRPGI